MDQKNVVTIGGGKGQGTILQGLTKLSKSLDITAIISTFDNGGSTGRIREELGIPSFGGDFRDVMTSLSEEKELIELFQHRYEYGKEIKGHSVGNLILLGLLEQSNWEIPKAITLAKRILNITADIIPSTLDNVHLIAEFTDGSIVKGQNQIDDNLTRKYTEIAKIYTEPTAHAYPAAIRAITNADALILCPGDLYGSLLCNLIVEGIPEAIARSKAKIIYVVNLMTKINQTDGWKASKFIKEVQKYLPRQIDYVILNTGKLTEKITGKAQYVSEGWNMVENDIQEDKFNNTIIIKDELLLEGKEFKRVSTDVIPRSFIRHDTSKIAQIIKDLLV